MADAGPAVRLKALQADDSAHEEIFRLLCDGKTPRQIAKEWKLPRHAFCDWLLRVQPDILARARTVQTDELISELLPEMREALTDPETAPAFKVKFDAAMKLAGKWDRTRYGEHVKVERTADLGDATAFLEAATNLLRDIKRPEKVIGPAYDPATDDPRLTRTPI